MTKTLNVHFSPREGSYSKELKEFFVESVKDKTEVIDTDLVANQPSLLPLNDDGKAFDDLQSADYLVLSFPIWNFDAPGAIKAWMDQVWIPGRAFEFTAEGPKPLLSGKKALIIMTSGGNTSPGVNDYATDMLDANLKFAGITDIEHVFVHGFNKTEHSPEDLISDGKVQISEIVKKWYS